MLIILQQNQVALFDLQFSFKNTNFEYKVHNVRKDDRGNYLILDTTRVVP